jgi:hypothetical protein
MRALWFGFGFVAGFGLMYRIAGRVSAKVDRQMRGEDGNV